MSPPGTADPGAGAPGAGGPATPPPIGAAPGSAGATAAGAMAMAMTMAPQVPMGDAGACPAAPADAKETAKQALMIVNDVRVKAGSGCINMVSTLNQGAQAHCDYLATNQSNNMCMPGGHGEVMGCMGFTGADSGVRDRAAGYTGQPSAEVLNFYGDMPMPAIQSWINTVYHRIPILDPWTAEMGWGGAAGCDVIDFGHGKPTSPADTIVVYPYDGQTNVPTSFSGGESPMPPAPSGGWPSSYPINIYAQRLMITEHVLTKDGDTTPLPHVWIDSNSNTDSNVAYFLINTAFMYGEKPFEPMTKYRVKMVGTSAGKAIAVEWAFTTGMATRPFF